MAAAPTLPPFIVVAPDLAMDPSQTCTQTLGAIAAKGGGKSYLASVIVEGLYDAAAPFAVFDPIGNWHALTLAADGKSTGLGVVVIGGERADVPLVEDAAEALGEYLVTGGVSAVLDVSELSKARRKVYVAAIAESMFRAARKAKRPYMVVLEEAQLFAPQVCPPGEQRMLGAITDIVRLGRNHGLGSMLITQRPQSVSKEVLNQVECLFVGQLRGPQERKAIAGWISEQSADDARAGLDELPKLSPGEFFCWSPSWLRTFRKIRVAKKRTFDGSSTPVLGQGRRALPAKGARAALSSLIAELGALGAGGEEPEAKPASESSAKLQRALERVRELEAENFELGCRVARLEAFARPVREAMARLEQSLAELPGDVATRSRFVGEVPRMAVEPMPKRTEPRSKPQPVGNDVDGPGRAVLAVLAWQKAPISRQRLALLSRYSPKGGAFGNVLSRLRVPGFISGSGEIEITEAGRRAVGKVERPPTSPDALFEWWLAHPRIDGPMAKILTAARNAKQPLTSAELAERAGYAGPNMGGFSNPLSRLRVLGLITGKGKEKIRIADELR